MRQIKTSNPQWEARCSDIVSLIKRDGSRTDNIRASVHPGKIHIYNDNHLIEEGDQIERCLSNGGKETYIVADTGFIASSPRMAAHYQMTVRKETSLTSDRAAAITHNYNLSGHNARVNVSSTDNSINVVGFADVNAFAALRECIATHVPEDAEQGELLARLDDLEEVKDTPGFGQKYRDFVGTVADHWSLFGPLLLALAQHLR